MASISSAVLFSPSASRDRICSRKGIRSGFPPLSFRKTRFACLEEHPKIYSTFPLLDLPVRLSRSVSKRSRIAITSESLSSPPATSKSSQSKSSVSCLSVICGSAKLEINTTFLFGNLSNLAYCYSARKFGDDTVFINTLYSFVFIVSVFYIFFIREGVLCRFQTKFVLAAR